MPNRVRVITIRDGDRPELERLAWRVGDAVRVAERARIVLLSAEGMTGHEIAACVGCSEPTVVTWRRRYAIDGLDGLTDRPRPGAPSRVVTDAVRREILGATLHPPVGAGTARPWSSRRLADWLRHARGIQVSHDSVCRVWRQCGIAPAEDAPFRLVADPDLYPGSARVLGLYLRPPQCALVLGPGGRGRRERDAGETRPVLVALRAGPRRAGSVAEPAPDLTAFLAQASARWPGIDLHAICGRLPPDLRRPAGPAVPGPRVPSARVRMHWSCDDAAWPCQIGVCLVTSDRPYDAEVRAEAEAVDEVRGAVATFVAAWPVHPIPFSWLAREQD